MHFISSLISSSLVLFAFCCMLASCSETSSSSPVSSRIQETLGAEMYSILKNPKKATVFRIKPQLKIAEGQQPEALGPMVELKPDQIKQLQDLLLNDRSYHFDLTKKCIFFAEIAFKFQRDGDVIVYVNPSCSQFKFVSKGKMVLLDYDPAKLAFDQFLKELHL